MRVVAATRAGADAPTIPPLPALLWVAVASKPLALVWWWLGSSPVAAAAVFFAPDLVVVYHLLVPSAQGLCRTFTRFETDRNEIWLTIDDGPDEHDTPRILDLLDQYEARATFFVIGERAARHPGLVAEIRRRGHEIAHHTHTHPMMSFWCASPARLRRELDRALAVLERAGVRPRWFRAPVGIKHPLLEPALATRGLACVGWSVRSGDCLARSAEQIVASVMRRVRVGDIVLMHEGPAVSAPVRVRAIALLLDACAARNIRCVLPAPAQLRSGGTARLPAARDRAAALRTTSLR